MSTVSNIIENLHSRLIEAFGFNFPATRWLKYDWANKSASDVENFSKHFAAIEINELLAWETKSASLSRSNWLDRMKSVACSNAANLHSSTASDIKKLTSISQYMPTSLTTCSEDTVLIKINHGFWEQIYLIINDGYDPIIMRPTAKLGYQESYLNSRFLDALLFFSRKHASVENSILKFNLIDFGFSYNNGDFWNNEISEVMTTKNPLWLKIMRGSAAGLKIFFSNFPNHSIVEFIDGAYAKQGLFDGKLFKLMSDIGEKADHIFFVVPGHLSNLRYTSIDSECQTVLHVSNNLVHESWPVALAGVGTPILERVASGEHVAVIVQAAVFSVLLAEYLLDAKKQLGLNGRITFLDVGQALDIMAPDTGSIWIKKASTSKRLNIDFSQIPLSI